MRIRAAGMSVRLAAQRQPPDMTVGRGSLTSKAMQKTDTQTRVGFLVTRRGFEPRMQLLTAYSLSRGAPSASRPPHHTPLTSASKNLFIAHRRCVAHILLSETYKSNNFSHTFIVCTIHTQLVCKNVKKSVLSTEKRRSDR